MGAIDVRELDSSPSNCASLSDLLVETVALGGSVTFMHPLSTDAAREFWEESLASAERGERIVLGALDGATLAGTVTLLVHSPPNQRHRAEISKMMTRSTYRGRGIGTQLMHEAERLARERGRPLLSLDTASPQTARRPNRGKILLEANPSVDVVSAAPEARRRHTRRCGTACRNDPPAR